MSESILKRIADHIERNDFFEDDYDEGCEVACDGCDAPCSGNYIFCSDCWQRIADALSTPENTGD